MKYLGCSYYPEYCGAGRFEPDAVLMKEACMNIVRIGEFAWSRLEPEEGVFTMDWLHEFIEIMGRHGINIILCTPTAAPPAWLTSTYRDTLLVKADGKALEHGTRRHYCYSSDTYRRHVCRIVDKLSKELSVHENIIGWQIDNEPDFVETGICYCETCQGKFQAWLKNKYGSIDELNNKWATGFWSMDYTDWRQVRLAEYDKSHYPSRKLDTRRFAGDMLAEYILLQAEIIRKNHPGARTTTNLNGSVFTGLDYSGIFSRLDVASKDLYFDICTMDVNALIMNQFRSFKPDQKYWITETGAGAIDFGRPAHKEQFKAWMWSSFAHGADAYVIFRWRTCLSGQEQELQGILEHSGYAGHRYETVKEAFVELREMCEKLGDIAKPRAEVAFIHDYDNFWGYESSEISREISYEKNFCRLHEEFYKRNVLIDVITVQSSLEPYKLIVIPSLMMIDQKFAENLKTFVKNGGVVFAQGQIGMRDFNNNYLNFRGPEHLQELFGVLINGGMYLFSQVAPDEAWKTHKRYFEMGLEGKLGGRTICAKASEWVGDLEINGGTALMSYCEDTYAGQPAVVEKSFGQGKSIYAAAMRYDGEMTGKLVEYALKEAGAGFIQGLPEYVEVIRCEDVTFVINHNGCEVTVGNLAGKALKGEVNDGKVTLKQYGVAILKESVI
jgi:beta-galactosidase